ncbi:MAG: nucleotidyl transferase AbiEii/AbiGii toxin family protein [Candidatus Limnocylindria bacterium]|nr:nucleotidyl transferase AbiEii/AbiGii toxin family protein [Candidatus Limnocylindria bacterium]
MIPRAAIVQWGTHTPWPSQADIEQDLVMSRLIVDIANQEFLGREFVMRGGTCLHKLHLPAPLRYSEDLDYNRRSELGIKEYVDAIEAVAKGAGLSVHNVNRAERMFTVRLQVDSTDGLRPIRIKVETNMRETQPCYPTVTRPYKVESSWWSGEAAVPTFEVAELMGTKLRALVQRSKGRDLFDLWLVLTQTKMDDARIITALRHYMGDSAFTCPQLARDLRAKLADATFLNDLGDLIQAPPQGYDVVAAADLLMERIGSQLKNAPPLAEIQGGKWR